MFFIIKFQSENIGLVVTRLLFLNCGENYELMLYFLAFAVFVLGGGAASPDFSSGIQRNTRPAFFGGEHPKKTQNLPFR